MCDANVIEFFIEEVSADEFKDKRVLEIGSKYVNGSIRPLIEKFLSPKEYVGTDIENGKYVDVVLGAENLLTHFGAESFDIVVTTELLEHVSDWRLVIGNIKGVLKPAGKLYITTRSLGMPFHSYPYDFWRFEVDDMRNIFSDFEIISLRKDPGTPGVFLNCRKPLNWKPKNLEGISLFSMVSGRRTADIPRAIDMPVNRKAKFIVLGQGRKILKSARSILRLNL